jgi:hypothetical protein
MVAIVFVLFLPLFPLSAQFCPTSNDAWYPPFTFSQRAEIAQAGKEAIISAFPKGPPPLAAILLDEHGVLWWSAYGGADEVGLGEMGVFSSGLERLRLMLKADGTFPDLASFFKALEFEGTSLSVKDLATLGLVVAMDGEFMDKTLVSEAAIRKVGFDWRFQEVSESGWALAYRIDPRARLVAVVAGKTKGTLADLPPAGELTAFYEIPNHVLSSALSLR